MPIDNPSTLVEEFKKTGEFDRLRRELLTQFQRDDSFSGFKDRIEDIARQRLTSDQMLHYMPPDIVHKELRQEVDRFPVVERAVVEVRILSDPAFLATVQSSVQKILRLEKGGGNAIAKDHHPESVKTRTPVTENHLEKFVHDAQVPSPSKLSESMVTGVSSALLTTVPFQPPPKEDEANPESAFESTNLSESTPQMVCNDAETLNQSNIADVEVKDLNSQTMLHM